MVQVLGLAILSLFITFILIVPFIDFLYKIKLRRVKQKTLDVFDQPTQVFDRFNAWKTGTPFGGGILIIGVVTFLTLWSYGIFSIQVNEWELLIILFTLIGFGLLGLYDDVKKLSISKNHAFFGLRVRHKLILQFILALIISTILYFQLGYNFLFIKGIGLASIGLLYIPFAAFVIVSFANAFNITDGLDGLASGLFLICLLAFLAIATPVDSALAIFLAILIGSVSAFLYFNIYKARLWLGDVGSLSLGASLAVIGLLTGKIIALAVIGGVFVIEVGSSLIQLMGKRILGKKLLPVAPIHLYFLKRGWGEPRTVMRGWLLGFFFAILGLYIAFLK